MGNPPVRLPASRYTVPSDSQDTLSTAPHRKKSRKIPIVQPAKAGIISLTKSIAEETAGFGVRVNAVCPGWIDTPLLAPLGDKFKSIITSRIGMGRMGKPDEIAELVRFLCGPESSYCTGDVFSASGGYN